MNNLNLSRKKSGGKSWKFWALFWSTSVVFLVSLFIFLNFQKGGVFEVFKLMNPLLKVAPIEEKQKEELRAVFEIASKMSEVKEVQTFLILFQNNLEIRPGGGYIGSFGILKLKEGQVISIEVHDTNIFDDRISTGIMPPYPMTETLRVKNWEMRDSNWSPDFEENAHKAVEFYTLEGGEEQFNGVIAISTRLLTSFLEFTGPIAIPGFPGEYTSENAILKLEYHVEKGYKEQDIEKGKRKYIMKDLAREILNKASQLSLTEKKDLLLRLEKHLNEKDVLINFFDVELQEKIESLNWGGEVNENYSNDYLMMVDANLAAYKSDAKMVRSFEYQVDFRKEAPIATLDLTYKHTAQEKDWMTNNYQSYLRIYTPKESWLLESNNYHPMKFGEELNKKYFGTLIQVPLGQTKTFHYEYRLPERITFEDYRLMIQKQSGIPEIKGKIRLIDEKGISHKYEKIISGDWELVVD